MSGGRFLWRVHPARGLAEAAVIGLGILFVLSRQMGVVEPAVIANGLMFLCGVCGMWCVLRIRLPGGGWLRQVAWELAVTVLLSAMMAGTLWLAARLLGWEGVWRESSLGGQQGTTLLLLATGPGYLVARLGARLWQVWDRLRRQRMVWSLTHAHLMIVVAVACLGAIFLFVLSPYIRTEAALQPGAAGLLTSVTEYVLQTLFPGLSALLMLTMVVLMALLPPSALFSFLVARRTTRRLETLAAAAQALRQGRYDTRVAVAGEDEVGQLQADFNAMAGDLERTLHDLEVQRDAVARLLANRRELVASVSHELRTPVATASAMLESALAGWQDEPPETLKHDLEVMDGEMQRLGRLIDDLLALSQAEIGALALDCRALDLEPVIQRMVAAMAPLAWSAGRVEVISDVAAALPAIQADEGRLEQVLANLVHNGIRHTPPGGMVGVFAHAEPEVVVVEVRDTGEGIAPEDLAHIWERFYRGQGSRADGGAGLGLALVRELVEAMGGSVAVCSRPGEGSCFTVGLRRA